MPQIAYTPSSLRKHVRKSDFNHFKTLRNEGVLHNVLRKTAFRANGTQPLTFRLAQSKKRGKTVYTATTLSDQLLLRKASAEIARARNSPSFSRELLIPSIKSLLEEAPPYNIYRFDIASFYESFDANHVITLLKSALPRSPHTKNIAGNLLSSCRQLGCPGLPRGIGISQSISELMLSPLDEYFMCREDVFFFGRYVDDIILLTEPHIRRREAIELILQQLPEGMRLNQTSRKKKVIYIPRSKKDSQLAADEKTATFSYLGYQFNISNVGLNRVGNEEKNKFRTVNLDIAHEKVKKIKTKLIRAIIDFIRTPDFLLLEQRIKLLTSNYSLPEKSKRHKRLTGIFYKGLSGSRNGFQA